MNLQLYRIHNNDTGTIGFLCIENQFFCFTLEDPYREQKIPGDTRIPQGHYNIEPREVVSGMTETYRNRFDWFDWHLELQGVPDFEYVYIHIGNQVSDTEGCILVGQTADASSMFVGRSTDAYVDLYRRISQKLNNGQKVTIRVIDFVGR